MRDIEEDIKRCEQLTETQNANWIGISNQLAIAHVVDRAKEVKDDLTTVYFKGYADAEEKYREKVKDKIKEIKRLRDRTITSEGFNILNGEVIVLEELLEEK